MNTSILLILILIGILFGLFVALFVIGIWYGRHHRDKITAQIAQVHETIKDVRSKVQALTSLAKH